MPLKLVPPGKRKGNRTYIIRGRFEGVDIEKATETTDKAVALRIRNEIERRILERSVPGKSAIVTFHRALDLYLVAHPQSSNSTRMVERLKAAMPDKDCRQIVKADIDAAAAKLHPNNTPETRNRNVYTPTVAVLNYAAENEWCEPRRFKRPKMKKPETRAATDDAIAALLEATTGKKHLLLTWLAYHGSRISNALAVEWTHIDFERGIYTLFVTKIQEWREFPLHPGVKALLLATPEPERQGRLFPWRIRSLVYRWLKPLAAGLNVKFTPHMARHWLGKQLDKTHAGTRAIANALGQTSMRSAERYVSSDLETVRRHAAQVMIGTVGEKVGEKRPKSRKKL